MLTTLYILYSLALTLQLVLVFRLKFKNYTLLLVIVLLGLLYDNAVLALGKPLGVSSLLEDLSLGRFIAHALGTPLTIIFAFGVTRQAGIPWAKRWFWHLTACLLTTILVFWGMYHALFRLALGPRAVADLLLYTSIGEKIPPLAPILTIFAALGLGAALWRQNAWPWLFAGALTMLLAAIAGIRLGMQFNNLGEVFLGAGCLATAFRFWPPKIVGQN